MFKAALLLTTLLFTTAAWADVKTAREAFDRGEFNNAIAELQPLAQSGDPEAQYWLGRSFDAAGDPEHAAQWFGKAASAGHDEAQRVLGLYYTEGKGVAKDDLAAAC